MMLYIDWKLSDPALGKLASKQTLTRPKQAASAPGHAYQTIQTQKRTGHLDVTASLPKTGFLSSSAASSTLLLDLVEDASVDPAKIKMFHHSSEQAVGKVLRGSGYFLIQTEMKGRYPLFPPSLYILFSLIPKDFLHPQNEFVLLTTPQYPLQALDFMSGWE